jgi:hypothetical protein
MNLTKRPFAALLLAGLLPGVGLADPYVYPAKGQSKQQQEKDTYECYGWAKQQSGFDPMKAPQQAYSQPQQATEGGLFRGAGRGAAVGAVGGAIGGNAGKGAAIGALAGGVIGGARRRHQANEISAEQQQARANYQGQRSSYDRAYSACLRGRGYTVN